MYIVNYIPIGDVHTPFIFYCADDENDKGQNGVYRTYLIPIVKFSSEAAETVCRQYGELEHPPSGSMVVEHTTTSQLIEFARANLFPKFGVTLLI